MIRQVIEDRLRSLVGELPAGHEVEFIRDGTKGDVASNIAFLLSRVQRLPPRKVAEELAAKLTEGTEFSKVVVGGGGFLNFTFSDAWLQQGLAAAAAPDFGRSSSGNGLRVNVEFVSANPTGPLNIVNARAGAYGAAVVSLLNFTGHRAVAEYYVNDSGRQAMLLGASVAARVAELQGAPLTIPEDGYRGEYLVPIARELLDAGIPADGWQQYALDRIITSQQTTLKRFGIHFDEIVRESAIRPTNHEVLARLKARGASYERDGAIWFRASDYGDTEDRVLVKSDGEPTYALSDINYHRQKFERGFDRLITVWGPDHHGDVARLVGGLKALGYPAENLKIVIVQWTTLLRAGQRLGMSKRAGEFVTIDEVLDEIGADALKFFLLMRRASQHLEFDLALARQTSAENPVYYAQYGHARIASILNFARGKGYDPTGQPDRLEWQTPVERNLIRTLLRYPDVVDAAAKNLEPHRVIYYILDLANAFHLFYENARVVSDDTGTTAFRLYLCRCTKQLLRSALTLVGISAPDRM